jgi:hypothetical protein
VESVGFPRVTFWYSTHRVPSAGRLPSQSNSKIHSLSNKSSSLPRVDAQTALTALTERDLRQSVELVQSEQGMCRRTPRSSDVPSNA